MFINWKKEEQYHKNTSGKHMKEVNVKKSMVCFTIFFFGVVTALKTVRKGIQVGQNISGWKTFGLFSGVL